VLQPNFRGSTGYGKGHVEKGFGQWGGGMIDDMEDGVQWLAGQGTIDPARVCIMGTSYGGYAALWAPIRSPQRYRCAISLAGVGDVRAMLRYDSRTAGPHRYVKEWKKRVEGEEKNDLAAISPRQHAAGLRVPLLIAHGEQDTNVPASQTKDMVKALAKHEISPETIFYPEAGHGLSRPEDMVDFLTRVEAFLAKHNPS
jgi:dipeptidyl aminopeptidase/acylaminoacyl peptidase